ncbi:histidine phosphatase family protein [Spirochaeta isovalerica]|uniref:2,3-bisphosphoglycerate-dependent phosphoglycerate mutase n=1 Tax=Spirochaeta isovalerica TaxID=150 RepID=A0A841RFH9_9SPIO|nr:histidine phosphatase family protein [Spirochaeta isovalerica]MBB6482733.1 2,3-bisphosphoglycerate-dependent phosphoglycerate mutase [Spirochaeta isovalerica]
MTRLFFIRHAESDYSIKDDFYRPLTSSGSFAAKKIPDLFENTHIDHFYSSPFVRSVHTIQYLANQCEKNITLCPNLQERKVGSWVEDFFTYAQKQWHNFDYKIENGESLNEVQKRNINEINVILQNHQNQNVVIGTHGTSLCTILNHFDAQFDFEYFQSIAKKMPLFIELQFNDLSYIAMNELHTDALANVL